MKITYFFLFATVVSACQLRVDSRHDETTIDEAGTKKVLDHHWDAFKANDLEETMKDYTEESVLVTPNATYKGLEEIRTNFVNAFKGFPKDSATFNLEKSVVVKD